MMVHVVLADDEVLARQKLRHFLGGLPEVDIVGEGSNAADAIELVRTLILRFCF